MIEGFANNCEYCWYCIEGVGLQEHNAWLLNDDFTGLMVDGSVRQDYCNHDCFSESEDLKNVQCTLHILLYLVIN